jgi:hypothetical protein
MLPNSMNTFRWLARGACLLVVIAGCGKSKLQTVPVQGKVTWQGKPLANADIAFHPQKLAVDGPHRLAIGKSDAEGQYTLSTIMNGDGVQPGEYAVVIVVREGGRIVDAGENLKPSPIPSSYTAVSTTPLKASIPADASGPLEFNFEIKE